MIGIKVICAEFAKRADNRDKPTTSFDSASWHLRHSVFTAVCGQRRYCPHLTERARIPGESDLRVYGELRAFSGCAGLGR